MGVEIGPGSRGPNSYPNLRIGFIVNFQEWDDWREQEFGKFENIKRFRVTNWVPSVQRGSVGSSNEIKSSKVNRRSDQNTRKRKHDSTKSSTRQQGYNNGKYNQAEQNESTKSG